MTEPRVVLWVSNCGLGMPFFGLARGARSVRDFVGEVQLRYAVETEVNGGSVYVFRRGSRKLVACVEFPEGSSPALPVSVSTQGLTKNSAQ